MKPKITKLLILDRNPLELVGLKSLFTERSLDIVAETASGSRRLEACILHETPDVILIDFHSYDDLVDDITRFAKLNLGDVRVIWLLLEDSDVIKYDAISALADGCVVKSNFEKIVDAVSVVLSGEVYFSRRLLAKFAHEACLVVNHLGRKALSLTRREREVLQLVRLGYTNAAIGRELGISTETAKAHLRSIRATLGVGSRRQMISCLRPVGQDPEAQDFASVNVNPLEGVILE